MDKSYCFAYYGDGKFLGWYADSFGSARANSPKLYSDLEKMLPTLTTNLTSKLTKINSSSFEEAKQKVTGLIGALGLAIFDSEDLLRGKDVELRAVECPYYDGPNLNYDEARAAAFEIAQLELPKEQRKRVEEGNDWWVYADYNKVRVWATNEPTEFVAVIKPELV